VLSRGRRTFTLQCLAPNTQRRQRKMVDKEEPPATACNSERRG
jgi:hypothetical protein